MRTIEISKVNIALIEERKGHIAFITFVINDVFYVSGIALYRKLGGGYRLVYPTKKVGNQHNNLFYPVNREVGSYIEKEVISKYKIVIKNGRYSSTSIT